MSACVTAVKRFFFLNAFPHSGINTDSLSPPHSVPQTKPYLSLFQGQKEFLNKGNGLLVSLALGRRTKERSQTISGDRDEQFQPYLLVLGISTANVL